MSPPHWGWVCAPSTENFGTFHLKWLIFVQIQLYFYRNVTCLDYNSYCIDVLLAAEGGGVRSNQSNASRQCHGSASNECVVKFAVLQCCWLCCEGILLIIHGQYHGVALTACLGVLVMVLCICVLPGAYIGLRHWRQCRSKQQRTRRAALNAIKEQASFVNDSALINQVDTVSVVDT